LIGSCWYESYIMNRPPIEPIKQRDKEKVILVCPSTNRHPRFAATNNAIMDSVLRAFEHTSYHIVVADNEFDSHVYRNYDSVQAYTEYPSHDRLMPYADVVITHGGRGVVHRSLWHGLPAILVPISQDHVGFAGRCEELGVSRVLHPEELNAEKLRHIVEDVQRDDLMRAKVNEMSAQLSKRTDSNVLGAEYIEKLLRTLT